MFVFVGRPDPTPLLLRRQREVFRIAKGEIDAAPRLLGAPSTKDEVGDEEEEDNSEDAKLEEMDGNDENSEDVNADGNNEEEEEMDDDVSRRDSFYDTKEDGDKVADSRLPPVTVGNKVADSRLPPVTVGNKVADSRLPPATAGLLLLIFVLVGLVVTWYTRKVQRRRSGLRKKIDIYS
jgi:hypothetical protein